MSRKKSCIFPLIFSIFIIANILTISLFHRAINYENSNSTCVEIRRLGASDNPINYELKRPALQVETYVDVLSPPEAYHGYDYFIFGILYEKGGSGLDIGAPYCPLHIYLGNEPFGEGFVTQTNGTPENQGWWEYPIPMDIDEGDYDVFVEFRGQVLLNGTIYEYDPDNLTLDPDLNENATMIRFPSNETIGIQVFYNSNIEAEISEVFFTAGDFFWINGSVTVNETREAIPNAVLILYLDGDTKGQISTGSTGEFQEQLKLSNSTDPGGHVLTLEYGQYASDQNEDYGSSYVTWGVHFQQAVKIEIEYGIFKTGTSFSVNGSVRDIRGEPISDPLDPQKVYQIHMAIFNQTDDRSYDVGFFDLSNGTNFTASGSVPNSFPGGDALIFIEFIGDMYHVGEIESKTIAIKSILKIDLTTDEIELPVQNITGKVTDISGRGIIIIIEASMEDVIHGIGKTDIEGNFNFQIQMTDDIDEGDLVISLTTAESVYYPSVEQDFTIRVSPTALPLCDLAIPIDELFMDYTQPLDGSGELNISFTVYNLGNIPSESTNIQIFRGEKLDRTIYLDKLNNGSRTHILIKWDVEDTSDITIRCDPDGLVKELSEDNNNISFKIPIELYDLDGDGEINYNDVDDEGDGLEDDWEIDNLLNLSIDDANLDPDNDEFTNMEEFLNNTDPWNPESYPIIQDENEDGNNNRSLLFIMILIIIIISIIGAAFFILRRRN